MRGAANTVERYEGPRKGNCKHKQRGAFNGRSQAEEEIRWHFVGGRNHRGEGISGATITTGKRAFSRGLMRPKTDHIPHTSMASKGLFLFFAAVRLRTNTVPVRVECSFGGPDRPAVSLRAPKMKGEERRPYCIPDALLGGSQTQTVCVA